MKKCFVLFFALALPMMVFGSALQILNPSPTIPAQPVLGQPVNEVDDGAEMLFWVPVTDQNSYSPRAPRSLGSLDGFDSLSWRDSLEGDQAAWTHWDLTALPPNFHSDTVAALGTNGWAWWAGSRNYATSTTPGGYDNNWFDQLISPTIDLSGSSAPISLTFQAKWKIEIGPATGCYDKWDGWNLSISTDGGTSWSIITNPTPAYTMSSSFAFGDIWCQGCNVPAYGEDASSAFQTITANLNAYAGQSNVKLRWVFCSDGGFSGAQSLPDGDSTFFGLLVDDILVTDNSGTVFSNDGSNTGGFTTSFANPAGDTWYYDTTTPGIPSPTHCWSASVDTSLLCAIMTPSFTVPNNFTIVALRYKVWCDMEDFTGGGGTALEDLYEIYVTTDNGVTGTRIGYDYATSDQTSGTYPGGGDAGLGWVERRKGLTSGSYGLLSLSPWAGQTVRLITRISTDCNDDGGVGSGLHVDNYEIWGTRAFNNDLTTSELIIPFPTNVSTVRSFNYQITNVGLDNQGTLIRGRHWVFRPDNTILVNNVLDTAANTTLAPNQSVILRRQATAGGPLINFNPNVVGSYRVRVTSTFAVASTDSDKTNDTTYSPSNVPLNPDSNLAVYVHPAGTYELGYHHRSYGAVLSNPRFVRYTPAADSVPGSAANYSITQLKVLWNYDPDMMAAGPTGSTARIQFWADSPIDSIPGNLIYTLETDIDTNESIGPQARPYWWKVNLTGVPCLQNRTGNFWVSLMGLDTVDGTGYPQVIAKVTNPQAFDNHNFTKRLDLVGQPINRSPSRFMEQVTIVPGSAPSTPAVSNLVVFRDAITDNVTLNWSAPSTCALAYKVYRGTSSGGPFGDLLTPTAITATTFTDVGAVASGVKYFYHVVAEY